jgi:hypothetical protein
MMICYNVKESEVEALSQKVIRMLVMTTTGLLTLALMVGATYLYTKVFYTNPLESSLNDLASIGSFKVEQLQAHSKIKVDFTLDDKLRSNFYILMDQLEGQKYKDLEQITIEVSNNEDTILRSFLTKARLPVFEAISTGKFSELPSYFEIIKAEIPVEYNLEIDSNFIFITATSGETSAHMVINRGNSPLNVINTMGGEYL